MVCILDLLQKWPTPSAHHVISWVLKSSLTTMKIRIRQVIRAFANPVAKHVYCCPYRWPRLPQVHFLESHYVGLYTHQLKMTDRLSSKYNFDKPNDGRALGLMNAAAVAVLEELPEVRLAYGISDEYRSSIQIPTITTDN